MQDKKLYADSMIDAHSSSGLTKFVQKSDIHELHMQTRHPIAIIWYANIKLSNSNWTKLSRNFIGLEAVEKLTDAEQASTASSLIRINSNFWL